MGAIAGRRAKKKKPSSPRTAAAIIASAMRQTIASSVESGSASPRPHLFWGRKRNVYDINHHSPLEPAVHQKNVLG
jgi:hypothetical protein